MFNIDFQVRSKIIYLFFIAVGAVPGAFIRWQLDNSFVVNFFGAGILGLVLGLRFRRRYQLLFGVGFCGALTTFSSLMVDSAELVINGFLIQAFGLITYTFFFGLFAGAFGFFMGREIRKLRHFLLR